MNGMSKEMDCTLCQSPSTSEHQSFLPAKKVDGEEVLQIYNLKPRHQPQNHIAWHQIIAQELYTTEQKPIHAYIISTNVICVETRNPLHQ